MGITNTRLLAAVMFTDIVGYTALMQEDEAKANEQRDRHREVLEKRASQFEGRTLHYYGDGALTIFNSAYNAVMCGIQIQKDLSVPLLPLRIGIHMGDIFYNSDDAYGDAVNIAARLESLSIPGGILISEKVAEEVKNHRQIKTVALGSFELKNVQRPMKIFAVRNEGLKFPSPKEIEAKSGRLRNRIAVLPFVNMSDELSFDYFSDGLTEEIINGLTKISALDVVSRTSAFAYKGRNEDIRSIGENLSVSHVLEGSVRKNKDKIRVTAQLIETEGGFHLWSETYERHLKDIFEIQDLICEEILEKFRTGLVNQSDLKVPLQTLTGSQYAYDSYLEGKFQCSKWTIPAVRNALQSFRNAINADPDFVEAHVELSQCYCYLGVMGQMSAQLAFEKAAKHVAKALKLDPYSAEAHAVKGLVYTVLYRDYRGADSAFTRALKISDQLPQIYHLYAVSLNMIGENKRALYLIEQALALDPQNIGYHAELGRAFYCAGRYPEALEQYNFTLELDASFLPAINGKGWTYVAMGEYKNAYRVFGIYQNLVSHEQKNIPQLVYLAGRLGMEEVAQHFLDVIQLGDVDDKYITTPVDVALVYLGLKKYDEVFFHLQRAVDDKIGKVMFLLSDPVWDEIKHDERYRELLDRLNLSDIRKRRKIQSGKQVHGKL